METSSTLTADEECVQQKRAVKLETDYLSLFHVFITFHGFV